MKIWIAKDCKYIDISIITGDFRYIITFPNSYLLKEFKNVLEELDIEHMINCNQILISHSKYQFFKVDGIEAFIDRCIKLISYKYMIETIKEQLTILNN